MDDFVQIGFVKKAHGAHGELRLRIEPLFLDELFKAERIFIDTRSGKAPYFIESLRGEGDPIVSLEDVGDRNQALALQTRAVWLRRQDLSPKTRRALAQTGATYADLVGFELRDLHSGASMRIEALIEMPQQVLASGRYRGVETLVPLNDTFVLRIDRASQVVECALPEGLLAVGDVE
ncbi:MAG: ribosome maturation factor RimM [Saprospiraceae bacterium]